MRGPPPKDPSLRQRRNKATTRARLPAESVAKKGKVPGLPRRAPRTGAWHPRVKAWWNAVWRSPMATEFLEADRQRLELIAELRQQFHRAIETDGKGLATLASEIRQQEVSFGLTPMDRRRLEWEVDRGEAATARTQERRKQTDLRKATEGKDPRDLLKAM